MSKMNLKTIQVNLTSASASNKITIASTEQNETLVIDDLQAIVRIRSMDVLALKESDFKTLLFSLKDKTTNLITDLLRVEIFNKGTPYSEDLLEYLTSKPSFTLSGNKELSIQVLSQGTTFSDNGLLGANDQIGIIGQAIIPDVQPISSVAARFNVSVSNTSKVILPANINRKGATIWNDSPNILYLDFSSTVDSSSFALSLKGDDFYEVPFGYVGDIAGIYSSGLGSVLIREFS